MRQVPLSLSLLHKWYKQGTAWFNNSLIVCCHTATEGKSQYLNSGGLLHNPNFATLCYIASHRIYGIRNEYSQKFPHKNYPIGTQIIFIRLSSKYSPSANTKLAAHRTTSWKKLFTYIFPLLWLPFLPGLTPICLSHPLLYWNALLQTYQWSPVANSTRHFKVWPHLRSQQHSTKLTPLSSYCTFLTASVALSFPNFLPTIGATSLLSCLLYLLLYPLLYLQSPLIILTYLLLQISSTC